MGGWQIVFVGKRGVRRSIPESTLVHQPEHVSKMTSIMSIKKTFFLQEVYGKYTDSLKERDEIGKDY
jgi:hypothetical protein